jgi:hypothetical protein
MGRPIDQSGDARSARSDWLRAVGSACLFGLGASLLAIGWGLVSGSSSAVFKFAAAMAVVCVIVPYVVMHVHLAASRDLSPQDKEVWHHQLMAGGWSAIVPFFYLLRRNREWSTSGNGVDEHCCGGCRSWRRQIVCEVTWGLRSKHLRGLEGLDA